jgi:hypothetical protein
MQRLLLPGTKIAIASLSWCKSLALLFSAVNTITGCSFFKRFHGLFLLTFSLREACLMLLLGTATMCLSSTIWPISTPSTRCRLIILIRPFTRFSEEEREMSVCLVLTNDFQGFDLPEQHAGNCSC